MDNHKDIYYVTYWRNNRILSIFWGLDERSGPFCVKECEDTLTRIGWIGNGSTTILSWTKLTPDEILTNWEEICADHREITP